MSTTAQSGSISIVRVPDGEAPLWVRRALVGLILPCDPFSGPGEDRGVLSGKPSSIRSDFSVPQNEMIGLLECHNAEAARWWKSKGYPKFGECFGFSKADVVVFGGVTRQSVIMVPDDCMGDPRR